MHLRNLIVGSLATVALFAPGTHDEALAQTDASIRIGSPTAKVVSRRQAGADVLLTASAGDGFEVLNREGEWYWVMLPPDAHGGRRSGWIHGGDVEGSEFRAAAQQKALDEAQAKAEKELQKIERQHAREAADEARRLKQTQEAAAKDAALRAKQQEVEAREAAEENRRLRQAAEQLEKARREYENSIKSAAVPSSTSTYILPLETISTRSVAASDFGETVQP